MCIIAIISIVIRNIHDGIILHGFSVYLESIYQTPNSKQVIDNGIGLYKQLTQLTITRG